VHVDCQGAVAESILGQVRSYLENVAMADPAQGSVVLFNVELAGPCVDSWESDRIMGSVLPLIESEFGVRVVVERREHLGAVEQAGAAVPPTGDELLRHEQ
jgi:hypothetical protein